MERRWPARRRRRALGCAALLFAGAPANQVVSARDVSASDTRTRAQPPPRRRLRQREAMYLPPAPVTPFRGGLRSVADDDDATSGEANVEAPSGDIRDNLGVSDPGTKKHSSARSSSAAANKEPSWAPEDYPDPWSDPILCGGAATASLMNEQYSDEQPYSLTELGLGKTPQQSEASMRRPLFCDPDRVLDRETLRNVAAKLKSFAETFASADDVQDVGAGVDFGADEDPSRDESEAGGDQDDEDVIQGVDFGESAAEMSSKSVDSIDETPEPKGRGRENDAPQSLRDADVAGQDRKLVADRSGARVGSHASHVLRLQLPEQQLYSDSVGGIFSTTRRDQRSKEKEPLEQQRIEVAIALVQKINLPAILRADSYFFYSDQDDMVNDAAQYFARYIHDTWSKRLVEEQRARNITASSPTNIVLIFISTEDRICYISSGTRIAAVLPWWRLEHVVQDMKLDLRKGRTGEALNVAIEDLTALLLDGPPSFGDRVNDFFERFGIVMLFTVFTFVFATWGECRDRRKRFFFAERRSRMTAAEREKARMLQSEFKTKVCPICLERFPTQKDTEAEELSSLGNDPEQAAAAEQKQRMGIPTIGSDGQPIKLLRCGHIFDKSCWSIWVDSGHGNPWVCPVCRQDLGRPKQQRSGSMGNAAERLRDDPHREDSSLFARIVATTAGPSMLLRPVTPAHSNYNSFQRERRAQRANAPFAPLSHPTMRRLHPMLGASMPPPVEEGLSEQTPLFAQASNTSEDEGDY